MKKRLEVNKNKNKLVSLAIFLVVFVIAIFFIFLNKDEVGLFKSSKEHIKGNQQVFAIRNIPEQTISLFTTDGDIITSNFEITCCSSGWYSSEDFQISPRFNYVVFGKKLASNGEYDSENGELFIFNSQTKEFEQLPAEATGLEISMWSQDDKLLLLFKDRTFYVYNTESRKIVSKAYAKWADELKYSVEYLLDKETLLLSSRIENLKKKSFISFNLNNETLEDSLLSKKLNQLQEQGYHFITIDLVGKTYALSPDHTKILITRKVENKIELNLINLNPLNVQVVDTNGAKDKKEGKEELLGFGDIEFSPDGTAFFYRKLESYGNSVQLSGRKFMKGPYKVVTETGIFDLNNETPLGFITNESLMVKNKPNESWEPASYSVFSVKDKSKKNFTKSLPE